MEILVKMLINARSRSPQCWFEAEMLWKQAAAPGVWEGRLPPGGTVVPWYLMSFLFFSVPRKSCLKMSARTEATLRSPFMYTMPIAQLGLRLSPKEEWGFSVPR